MFPEINIIAVIIAALIPNIVGALYYGPLFGKPWLQSLGFTAEDMKGRNEILIYGGSLVLSFILAFFLNIIIQFIHKDVNDSGELIMASHNTFGHGAMHGFFLCLGLVIPVIVSLALFQKATAKNIILNMAFWLICYTLMGGVLDMWR